MLAHVMRLGTSACRVRSTPYPTQAGNVEVTFDGVPAPLLWVQDAQINAAVPWEIAGPATQVCVTYNNVKTNCLTWPVAQATPAVFMQDSSYAAALNQDGTPNSAANLAQPNSIVSVFATGLGPISPAQPDGSLIGLPLPVNVLPIELKSCTVEPFTGMCSFQPLPSPTTTYAGPAQSQIAGVSQISFHASNLGSYLYVTVGSAAATSNSFQIHVAGQ